MATSNLLIFDMDANSLSNNTGYDDTGRAEGTMVYIPASAAGLLIYFGGVTFPYGNETEVAVRCFIEPNMYLKATTDLAIGNIGYYSDLRHWRR